MMLSLGGILMAKNEIFFPLGKLTHNNNMNGTYVKGDICDNHYTMETATLWQDNTLGSISVAQIVWGF